MKLAIFALLVCLVGSSLAVTPEIIEEWKEFKTKHQRGYGSQVETDMRFKIFVDNLIKIYRHNKEYDEGKHTYKKGVNQFTDMLHSEFLEKMTVDLSAPQEENNIISEKALQELMKSDVPEAIDWREKGAVTPVKAQGGCGSCWTFSTTGSLEGVNFVKNGKLISLSEQNLLDCTADYRCSGCDGGWPSKSFDYIFDNGGIDTEEGYPYEGKVVKCRYDANKKGASVTGHVVLPAKDEEALKKAVGTFGPVSILVNANGFGSYSSGIYNDPNCAATPLNHAVLAAGYGSENGQDFWLVKNSWGEGFGENGYIRIARNANNMCGVASSTVYPTV